MVNTSRHTEISEQSSAEGGVPSLSELLSALSFALDLTEGAVPGHALRSCLLGMRLGRELGFSPIAMADLYHALILKDIGCSSNAARICQIIGGGDDRAVKSAVKFEDWSDPGLPSLGTVRMMWQNILPGGSPLSKFAHILRVRRRQDQTNQELVQLRCDRGASILRKIGMSEQTALAVRSLDEHWDGSGYPERLKGTAISPWRASCWWRNISTYLRRSTARCKRCWSCANAAGAGSIRRSSGRPNPCTGDLPCGTSFHPAK